MPDPIARLGNPMDWPECEESHLVLSNDALAPLELASLSPATLDDLDWRAKAIVYGWHSQEETQEDIMALAHAVLRLTAALRRREATCTAP